MQALQHKHMQRGSRCCFSAAAHKGARPGRLTTAKALNFPSFNTQGWGGGATMAKDSRSDNKEDTGRDMTANMLQGIIKVAVQSRLHHHEGIQVNVESNAMDIWSGRFGGLTIAGQKWKTPLQLTAERLEVALGEMIVNYSALVLEQRISLRNVPSGTCTITLTAADLGNFVVHELLKEHTSKAVEDQAFIFDRDSVRFRVDPRTKEASVYLEGEWAGDDSRYLVKMTPSGGMSMKSLEQHAAAASARGDSKNLFFPRSPASPPVHKPQGTLRMVAHRVGSSTMSSMSSDSEGDSADGEGSAAATVAASLDSTEDEANSSSKEPTPEEKIAAAAAAILERSSSSESGVGSAESSLVSAAALNYRRNGGSTSRSGSSTPAPACNASRIEKGLGSFFTHLSLDLQGIELSKPSLSLLVPNSAEESDESVPNPPEQPLLTITMGLRMLAVPPMDMQF